MAQAAESDGFWLRQASLSIRAVSEALFPENELGAPDWVDTELTRRTREYIDELPPEQRRLVLALFIFVELATPVLCLRGRRFSSYGALARAEHVQRWRKHWFQPFRWLGDALKATMTMMYMSHPAVVKHISAYKSCERKNDPLKFPVDKNALRRMLP